MGWSWALHICQACHENILSSAPGLEGISVARDFKPVPRPDGRPVQTVYVDNVILVGDACHASLPSLGQGCTAALEDIVYLDACFSAKKSPSVEEIVTSYNNIRLGDSHAVTKLSEIGFGNSDRSNRGNVHSAMKYIGKPDISYSEILDIIEGKSEIPEV